ncbi:MAG: type II toxin-antitoxin system RelE/ParE family toxin [Fibrobacteria bacterium]
MKIFWTEKAIARISEIAQYIGQDSHLAAERWADKIIGKVEALSEFPKSGRKVPELNKKEYRELIFGNYRIIYKTNGETLYVLTVRHFKQILPVDEVK